MSEKVVIIGAGSAMFTRGLLADMLVRGWEGELHLVDINEGALSVVERLSQKMVSAKRGALKVKASVDRRDALPGATLVVTTIGVGGRRAWEQDVFIPRRYGIYQPVGDSVMPGGTSRGLRMVPPMVEIAGDVITLAPEALFLNYANPMPVICRAVRKATGASMVGLCIGVHLIAERIARWLGVDLADLRYTAAGMNHLTWFTELRAHGKDLMPRMKQQCAEALACVPGDRDSFGAAAADIADDDDGALGRTQPFCLQMLHVFGAYPAVSDRHVAEFFPHLFLQGNHFGKTLGVDRFSFEQTIERGDRIYAEMQEQALSPDPLDPAVFDGFLGEHSQAIEITESIRKNLGRVYSANLPNQGQVPNLPSDAIVEAPAVATAAGLRPIALPPLPSAIAGILASRFAWVETVVEAALEGSRDKFLQALLLDGAVSSVEQARELADALLSAHQQYLPQFRQAHEGTRAAVPSGDAY